jgi:hypothetical protein
VLELGGAGDDYLRGLLMGPSGVHLVA